MMTLFEVLVCPFDAIKAIIDFYKGCNLHFEKVDKQIITVFKWPILGEEGKGGGWEEEEVDEKVREEERKSEAKKEAIFCNQHQ